MTPVTAYYKLTAPFTPPGSYLPVSQGVVGPDGKPAALDILRSQLQRSAAPGRMHTR